MDRLQINNSEDDWMTRNKLSSLYNETYTADVRDDTARNEGKRIKWLFKQLYRKYLYRGVFVKVRIRPLPTLGDIMHTFAQNDQLQT